MKYSERDKVNSVKQTQRELLVERARDTVMGSAQRAYGEPFVNHSGIADLWQAYFRVRIDHAEFRIRDIDAEDVAMCMLLAKVARAAHRSPSPDALNEDTFVDMIGYAAIAGECREARVASDLCASVPTAEGDR